MTHADKLLDSLDANDISLYTTEPELEEHIVVSSDRFITVPESLKRIAVQHDHNVETVTFDCPRYWDGLDMSNMHVYINYMLENGNLGMYLADNVRIDDVDQTIMHFDWTVSNNVTLVNGDLSFLVCIKKTDMEGNEINHWNSELNQEMYISEGLECEETVVELEPDIITALLTRMDYVETIATPESMQEYVDKYLSNDSVVEDYTYNYLSKIYPTTPDLMQSYVDTFLEKHPPLLVIGSEKPPISCMWFNTGTGEEVTENTILQITAEPNEKSMYAVVEDTSEPIYNFDII